MQYFHYPMKFHSENDVYAKCTQIIRHTQLNSEKLNLIQTLASITIFFVVAFKL